uniref:Uncharacterized protein n=1 Tax=Arundo donax TaxID=35708 RepID=A0A0A8Z4Y5_ARUDO
MNQLGFATSRSGGSCLDTFVKATRDLCSVTYLLPPPRSWPWRRFHSTCSSSSSQSWPSFPSYGFSREAALRRDGVARLPPSPWTLPLIGHLHHLAGALPHRAMRDLAARHGPLMLLRLGGLPVVVAREVMRTRDLDFATRPVSRMVRLAIHEGAEGIIFAPYGDG